MSLHAVKNVVATRSPARQALAGANAEVAAAENAEESARVAVTRALELVDDGNAKVAATVAAVFAAKENHSAAVAAAIGMGATVPLGTLKAARAAQADAEDDLAAATAALEQLRTALADRTAETADANMRREAAINGVLANAAAGCEARIAMARNNLHEQLSVAAYVRARGRERQGQTSSFREIPTLAAALAAIAGEIDSALLVGTGAWDSSAALANPILGRWEKAVAELRVDADALLPD